MAASMASVAMMMTDCGRISVGKEIRASPGHAGTSCRATIESLCQVASSWQQTQAANAGRQACHPLSASTTLIQPQRPHCMALLFVATLPK